MKKILVIDDSQLFRDFLRAKLTGFGFEVVEAGNGFDGIMKMRQDSYDLVVMDYYLSRNSSLEVLEAKSRNPNTRDTPVIMASAKLDRDSLLKVSQFGVRKFFAKPLKVDLFVKALSELFHVNIEVDTTPCIIDAHYNDGILFVELSQGLNLDKIELLKYRLRELVDLHKIERPKVLAIMAGLELGPNDSLPLSALISVMTDQLGAKPGDIKILTASEFIRGFVARKPALAGIGVVASLDQAVDELLGNTGSSANMVGAMAEAAGQETGFDLRFGQESATAGGELTELKALGANARIAVVDDDLVMREIIAKAFSDTGIGLERYDDGTGFLAADPAGFDLVFLDLLMPRVDGFQVLATLKQRRLEVPVIVLSALGQKEAVVKALGYGVKSYIVKPVQAQTVCRKALEVLRMNF